MSSVVGCQKKKRLHVKVIRTKDKNEELIENKAKRERNYKKYNLKINK